MDGEFKTIQIKDQLKYWNDVGCLDIVDTNGTKHSGMVVGAYGIFVIMRTSIGNRVWINTDCIVSVTENGYIQIDLTEKGVDPTAW